MSIGPLWKPTGTLTVHQAAALLAGVDPTAIQWSQQYIALWAEQPVEYANTPEGRVPDEASSGDDPKPAPEVQTAFNKLVNGIYLDRLPCKPAGVSSGLLRIEEAQQLTGLEDFDWAQTTVQGEDVTNWLVESETYSEFFLAKRNEHLQDYLAIDPLPMEYATALTRYLDPRLLLFTEDTVQINHASSYSDKMIQVLWKLLGYPSLASREVECRTVHTIYKAMMAAIQSGSLAIAHSHAKTVAEISDWSSVTVWQSELKRWLQLRKIPPGMLSSDIPDQTSGNAPDYLNSSHPYYAPKLAAAVNAWLALQKEGAEVDMTNPSEGARKWLEAHKKEFAPSGKGALSAEAIKQVAKIVNWNPKGGRSPK